MFIPLHLALSCLKAKVRGIGEPSFSAMCIDLQPRLRAGEGSSSFTPHLPLTLKTSHKTSRRIDYRQQ